MKPQRVHFISLGCSKNRIDTETMLGTLPAGWSIAEDPDDADVAIINTCSFIQDAKEESIEAILDMGARKTNGKLKKLIVTGCLAQRYPSELPDELPEVDHFVGTADVGKVSQLLSGVVDTRVLVGSPDRRDYDWEMPRLNTWRGPSAYVKIAEGCSNTCAFCIIPSIRGPQRSRPIASIVAEAKRLAAQGVLELNLVAQDLTAYGYDLEPRQNLTGLLAALVEVDGIHWVRLLYAYPRSFPTGLIDFMVNQPKIVPYLDMPLQHCSDNVLAAMKRGTRSEVIHRRLKELRERIPNLALRTTLLVGHPGETEADFEQLLEFVREQRFERMGAFAFSPEEGTVAFDLPNPVPDEVKARRLETLMAVQQEIAREHNEAIVGREVEVLLERVSDESELVLVGRTAQQAPEVDGVTYLGLVEGVKLGTIVKAVVTQATDFDLAAEIIEPD